MEASITNKQVNLLFKDAEGKSIYAVNEPKLVPTILRKLKGNTKVGEAFVNKFITDIFDNNIVFLMNNPLIKSCIEYLPDGTPMRLNGQIVVNPEILDKVFITYYGALGKRRSRTRGLS